MFLAFNGAIVGQITLCCAVKLYCSALLALKKPGPGEGVRQRVGMSNIKMKAFRIILIITTSVIVMNVPLVIVILLQDYFTQTVSEHHKWVLICTAFPGFVQAFLFLQRSGKLVNCLLSSGHNM